MKKRILCRILAFALILCLLLQAAPAVNAATIIINPSQANGNTYSAVYGTKLQEIFQGQAKLFTNTTATFPLGSWLNNNTWYEVAKTYSGKQCYIYAQAVYYYLFGDVPRHGEGSAFWKNSAVVMRNQTSVSYQAFLNAGVGFGAYLRTTTATDGSYGNGTGHSMIILAYDTNTLTYLEGNGDGKGQIRLVTRTWSEFNSGQLANKGRRVGVIVQYLAATCTHSFSNLGVCTNCSAVYDFQSTYDLTASGCYLVSQNGIALRTEKPYSAAAASTTTIAKGTQVEVLGSVTNALGELWYHVSHNGKTGYVPKSALTFSHYAAQEIRCTLTSPAEGQFVPQASYPVAGTITSKYPIKTVKAYLDGNLFATVDGKNATTINIQSTAINYNLSFSSLAPGRHTITIVAGDIHHEPETVCTRIFITESDEPADVGDMDGDGILTTDDAVHLLLHVMFGDQFYPLPTDAVTDLNQDGASNTDDAVYLLLHVMFGAAFYPLP